MPRILPTPLRDATRNNHHANLVDLVNLYAILHLMKVVATNEAKTQLSALLREVSQGETIVIARGRTPLAKLIPYKAPKKSRPKVGDTLDAPVSIPEDALRPLSREELAIWGLA
jgi:prevent-host-death family protein